MAVVGKQYRGSTAAYGTTVDFNVFDEAWVRAWPSRSGSGPAPPAQEEENVIELAQHTTTGAVYAFVGPFKLHLSPVANEAMMARGAVAVRLGDTDAQHNARLDALPSFPFFPDLQAKVDALSAKVAALQVGGAAGPSANDMKEAVKDALREGNG